LASTIAFLAIGLVLSAAIYKLSDRAIPLLTVIKHIWKSLFLIFLRMPDLLGFRIHFKSELHGGIRENRESHF
jgi:hypothetical protein